MFIARMNEWTNTTERPVNSVKKFDFLSRWLHHFVPGIWCLKCQPEPRTAVERRRRKSAKSKKKTTTQSHANNRVNMRHWNGIAFTTFLPVVIACASVYVIVSNELNTFLYIKMNATSNMAINRKKSQQHTCSTIQQIVWVNSRSNADARARARARSRTSQRKGHLSKLATIWLRCVIKLQLKVCSRSDKLPRRISKHDQKTVMIMNQHIYLRLYKGKK